MKTYTKAFRSEGRQLAVAGHACPQCLAPPGVPCLGKRRGGSPRKSVHGPRFDLALGRTPRDHTLDRRREQPLYRPN